MVCALSASPGTPSAASHCLPPLSTHARNHSRALDSCPGTAHTRPQQSTAQHNGRFRGLPAHIRLEHAGKCEQAVSTAHHMQEEKQGHQQHSTSRPAPRLPLLTLTVLTSSLLPSGSVSVSAVLWNTSSGSSSFCILAIKLSHARRHSTPTRILVSNLYVLYSSSSSSSQNINTKNGTASALLWPGLPNLTSAESDSAALRPETHTNTLTQAATCACVWRTHVQLP